MDKEWEYGGPIDEDLGFRYEGWGYWWGLMGDDRMETGTKWGP